LQSNGRMLKLLSIKDTVGPLGRFFLMSCVVLVAVAPLSTLAQDAPDILDLQRQIDRNGWNFQVDDHFTNTLTEDERSNLRGYNPPPGYQQELDQHLKIYPIDKAGLPTTLNWRDIGGITSVKNQGSCGSCWAFAATAEMEAFIKIYYGKETDLSEQQSVSCNPYGAGCDGGWATASYYVFQNYGAVLENCSPYVGLDPPAAPCTQDDFLKYGTITGYNHISNDVEQIKAALQYGPVCTAIDAGPEFEAYAGGCFDVPGSGTNHLVLIVGYDDRSCGGAGAWLIKNSWGSDFGESGYITVAYGAASTGTSVTQLQYAEPPVSIILDSDLGTTPLYGDQLTDVTWSTTGDPVGTVDFWLGIDGDCHDILIEENVPNTGSYSWMVPNLGTNYASLVILPSTGTETGYDFTETPLTIIGHKTRYVSSGGSNTHPYETPATAAHTIGAAVSACTGTDTVLVTGGNYVGNVTVSTTVKIRGSWDPTFSVQDLQTYPTRLQGGNSCMRFYGGSGDYGSVENIVFHDSFGGNATLPSNGQHGGAIYSLGASPTIINCVFDNNRAAAGTGIGFGGAICIVDGAPTVENCEFTGNIASSGGAVGVFGTAAATFTDCIFTANRNSELFEDYHGAAFFVDGGALTISGGSITGGTNSFKGGALAMSQGQVVLDGVLVDGNETISGGGAISTTGGILELNNTHLTNNTSGSGSGGGIEATGTHLILRNTRIGGNTSGNIGGGVYAMSSTGVVENCQVDGNLGVSIGGMFLMAAGEFQVRNNMVFANEGGGMLATGAEMAEDWNNVWNNLGGDNLSSPAGVHDLSRNPLFVDEAVGDFGLACYSPCIDGGELDPMCLDPDGSRADIGLLGGPGSAFMGPAAVGGLALADLGGGGIRLTWNPGLEPDLDRYIIYRDTAEVFIPSGAKALASVTVPTVSFDDTPPAGDWYYLVATVNTGGYGGGYSEKVHTSGGVSAVGEALPKNMAIAQIAPNPFNPRTTIHFDVARSGQVRLGVYDLRGHLVRDLVTGSMEPGRHHSVWDGRDRRGRAAAAGVYFVRMTGDGKSLTRKMVLAK